MTLEQLRIFVAVAERQHVTRAASELNLTQSATSAAIAALEMRYGVKLFDRIGRGIALTQTGRDFLIEARAVLARAKAAAQVLDDLAGLRRGSATIAASQTVANYWLPGRIQTFHAAHPGIELKVTIANTEQVARAVVQGSADLGFVEGKVDDPLLAITQFDGDSLIVVVGAKHRWVGRNKISPKDLAATAWVLRERGSGTRSMFESALRKFGIKLSDLRGRAGTSLQRGRSYRHRNRGLRHRDLQSCGGAIACRQDAAPCQDRSASTPILYFAAQRAACEPHRTGAARSAAYLSYR